MIEKNVKLYLGDGYPVRIPVSQYDTMWRFVFKVVLDGEVWEIPQTATAVLNGRKPDGNVIAFSGTIANNRITVDSDIQLTAVPGEVSCELSIMNGSAVVGTANFVVDVEKAPKTNDDVISESALDAYGEILDGIATVTGHMVPAGGSSGQVLAKMSGDDYDTGWVNQSGGGGGGGSITVDAALSSTSENPVQNKAIYSALSDKYVKPSGGIPASDLANGVIPTVPTADSNTPQALGTASAGSSTSWSRGDHVHPMPSAADVGAEPAVTEITISSTGSVSQALSPGVLYHFTGSLTALTITLTAPATGQVAHYHFDYNSGSSAVSPSLPNTVTMQSGFTVEASKRVEIDILNNYGVAMQW